MENEEPSEIVLQRGVHHLLSDTDGVPYTGTGPIPTFTIWNCIDQSVIEVPKDAETCAFFGVSPPTTVAEPTISKAAFTATEVALSTSTPTEDSHICKPGEPYRNTNNLPGCPKFTPPDSATAPKPGREPASWKEDEAVKHLITMWKAHEAYFKSTTMRNEEVWRLIAKEMSVANCNWIYSGTQCENKFKDVRKSYIRVRDHNNQTVAEPKSYKFFDDMESVLGEKPCVKPVTVASNLNKKIATVAASVAHDEECSDEENLTNNSLKQKAKPKKTRVQKELHEWSETLREDAHRREKAREKRHLEGINTFEDVMSKLIDKL